jgi:hypothetical protein
MLPAIRHGPGKPKYLFPNRCDLIGIFGSARFENRYLVEGQGICVNIKDGVAKDAQRFFAWSHGRNCLSGSLAHGRTRTGQFSNL